MHSYFQLLQHTPKEKELIHAKAHQYKVNLHTYPLCDREEMLFSLELPDLKCMKKFDEAMEKENININSFLFTNDRFENLINDAKNYDIVIQDIKTSQNEEIVKKQITEDVKAQNFHGLCNLIDKEDMVIKWVVLKDRSTGTSLMKIYDSGTCIVDTKNGDAKSLVDNVIKATYKKHNACSINE